jgi:hypothetical protein
MNTDERMFDELVQIKKLLMFKILKDGADATELGKVLGVTSARIGQIIPVRNLKKKKGKDA